MPAVGRLWPSDDDDDEEEEEDKERDEAAEEDNKEVGVHNITAVVTLMMVVRIRY